MGWGLGQVAVARGQWWVLSWNDVFGLTESGEGSALPGRILAVLRYRSETCSCA